MLNLLILCNKLLQPILRAVSMLTQALKFERALEAKMSDSEGTAGTSGTSAPAPDKIDGVIEKLRGDAKEWQARLGYLQLQLDSISEEKAKLKALLEAGEAHFKTLMDSKK